MYPTKSVPGGCLVGVLGLALWVIAGLALYAAWLAKSKGKEDVVDPMDMVLIGSVAGLVGLVLIILGWRLAMRTEPYDPSDPDEPRVKF